jgi:hypothetical protein
LSGTDARQLGNAARPPKTAAVTGALDRSDGYNKSNAYDGLQLGCDLAMSSRVVVGGIADVSSGEQRDEIFTDPTHDIVQDAHRYPCSRNGAGPHRLHL